MTYEQFLESKRHIPGNHGINPEWIPGYLFDYQKYLAEYSIKKGRCANFIDTGLGKSIIEMVVAMNYIKKFNKPVLIITPLAVGLQFIKEAAKFGIDDIEYSKDGKYTKKIVIVNYERLHNMNYLDFECVILDESSILKNVDGAIKNQVTSFLKKIKYRYLFTATPSPNDFIELGTSSEALGYMGYMDMLTKFFTNNEYTVSPMNIGVQWVLKGHAKNAFFEWVSGWSISMRKPSDLGFSDERHILPELITNHNSIKGEIYTDASGQHSLFPLIAKRLTDVRNEQRHTIEKRSEMAVQLASSHDTSVYWCNLNDEADLIQEIDKDAVQVKGSMVLEKKEEILMAFSDGQIKKLITKPKITSFGLNWQHCAHTVFFPTFSYEQYYQAIRRFWRFGQTRPVVADLVYSEGQQRVMDSLIAKAAKATELFDKLNFNLHKDYTIRVKPFDKEIKHPSFI